jgi:hypothetical protein
MGSFVPDEQASPGFVEVVAFHYKRGEQNAGNTGAQGCVWMSGHYGHPRWVYIYIYIQAKYNE